MIMSPDDFLTLILGQVRKEVKSEVKFATVSPTYTGGQPTLIFDGDSQETLKTYSYLSSYSPMANDRVIVVKGVVLGKII